MIWISVSLVAALVSFCMPSSHAIGGPAATEAIAGAEAGTTVAVARDAIRREAQRRYGEECGEVLLPDRAYVSLEITGGGLPEYAVLLGRGTCSRHGNSGRWQGTGGAVVQFWLVSDGPPRLLLEHQMHGFSALPNGVLSEQHGAYCPGGAGPDMCLVRYEWNERRRVLELGSRRLHDDERPGMRAKLQWPYESISR